MMKIQLTCPYCGFEFSGLISYEQIYNAAKSPRQNLIYQICPDDQFADACGNGFFYEIKIEIIPKRYYADTALEMI